MDQCIAYPTLMLGIPKLSYISSCLLIQTAICANSQLLVDIQYV